MTKKIISWSLYILMHTIHFFFTITVAKKKKKKELQRRISAPAHVWLIIFIEFLPVPWSRVQRLHVMCDLTRRLQVDATTHHLRKETIFISRTVWASDKYRGRTRFPATSYKLPPHPRSGVQRLTQKGWTGNRSGDGESRPAAAAASFRRRGGEEERRGPERRPRAMMKTHCCLLASIYLH